MKKYGIYLAFPPTVDMRGEGLGRHLSEFLKSAQTKDNIRFVIACPSWMRKNLEQLFDASGIRADSFEIICPAKKPFILRAYEVITAFKKPKQPKGRLAKIFKFVANAASQTYRPLIKQFVGTRSPVWLVLLAVPALLLLLLAIMFGAIAHIAVSLWNIREKLFRYAKRKSALLNSALNKISNLKLQPKESSVVTRLYRLMEESEISIMHNLISARADISAWYSPTAFWPHFNQIRAPRLMCVPDVVLANFPVGFSQVGGQRFLENFNQVEQAITTGQHFVTYSEDVKWRTLVNHYHVDAASIRVVTHGVNKLDNLVGIKGSPDNEAATDALCSTLFSQALNKIVNSAPGKVFVSEDVKYIFYASQFRPNKNVITLLRAYEHLLKRRYIGHKLVLTGNPHSLPEIAHFIKKHNLENDVLCLKGLSAQELAACYRLADLAVNPSLSEGGCPFTFTEALSVNTPVVMARIPVTEEVITDEALQNDMLFDPYDWQDMAAKLEWALSNRPALLAKQKLLYEQLSTRTWTHVVDDYIQILDEISATN